MAGDFAVEVFTARPQSAVSPTLGPPTSGTWVDVTRRCSRADLGSVSRAIDRDLLTFKTGDMTVSLWNGDGYVDELLDVMRTDPLAVYGLRVTRRGLTLFYGAIIGLASVMRQEKQRSVAVTAYGPSKLLDLAAGENVKRSVAAMTATTMSASSSSHVISSTAGLLAGDVLHVTDNVNKEDVTIRQVTGGTTYEAEAPLVNSYAAGSIVTLTTPFYRYKAITWLVQQLCTEAGVALAELRLSSSTFRTIAAAPVNLSGLPVFTTSNPVCACPTEKDGKRFDTRLIAGTYRQASPDADWAQDDAVVRAWVDWSRYYRQDEAKPTILLRDPDQAESTPGGSNVVDPHRCGFEWRGATKIKWNVEDAPGNLNQRTTTDGTTWTGRVVIASVPAGRWNASSTQNDVGCEVDEARQQVYVWSNEGGGGPVQCTMELYSIGGGTWTNIRQADDVNGVCYGGLVYVPELDAVIGLRSVAKNGPAFEIVAWRNGVRLWKRPFPNCLVQSYFAGASVTLWPTHTLRYVAGKLYCVVVSDGKTQLVWSGDEFRTYTMKALTDPGVGPRCFGSRVLDAYHVACYSTGSLQRGLFVCAPFYAGVVAYADFAGVSVAEALRRLALLANAVFWVDDELQAHFVARDLYDGTVFDAQDRLASAEETVIWKETAQYVKVSGGGFEATSGNAAFASDGIELESPFLPTEATCQAAADSYHDFFHQPRAARDVTLHDPDGHVYLPMQRLTLDRPNRYLVYDSDHDIGSDEVRLTVLEDIA